MNYDFIDVFFLATRSERISVSSLSHLADQNLFVSFEPKPVFTSYQHSYI